MKRISKQICKIISLSLLLSFIFLPNAHADSAAPEIISVKPSAAEVYVGKKWTSVYFEVVIKDQSLVIKSIKSVLKSTNNNKDIGCGDVEYTFKTVSGDVFKHSFSIYCEIPRNIEAPDIRNIQFTAIDGAGLSSTYSTDVFNTKVNLSYGFDPKLIEKSLTDAGKLQLVQECINFERQRINTLEEHKAVAKFPTGNPFEIRYKEGKIALANSFNCNLGSDLLTRVSEYEDLTKRLSIGPGETLNFQIKLIVEKTNATKPTSITCIKGKTSKVVKGVNPKCPAGYRKK